MCDLSEDVAVTPVIIWDEISVGTSSDRVGLEGTKRVERGGDRYD